MAHSTVCVVPSSQLATSDSSTGLAFMLRVQVVNHFLEGLGDLGLLKGVCI